MKKSEEVLSEKEIKELLSITRKLMKLMKTTHNPKERDMLYLMLISDLFPGEAE